MEAVAEEEAVEVGEEAEVQLTLLSSITLYAVDIFTHFTHIHTPL